MEEKERRCEVDALLRSFDNENQAHRTKRCKYDKTKVSSCQLLGNDIQNYSSNIYKADS